MDSRISGNMMHFTNSDTNCLTHTGSIWLFSSIIGLESISNSALDLAVLWGWKNELVFDLVCDCFWTCFDFWKYFITKVCEQVPRRWQTHKFILGLVCGTLFQVISEGGREVKLSLWAVPYGFYRNPSCMCLLLIKYSTNIAEQTQHL